MKLDPYPPNLTPQTQPTPCVNAPPAATTKSSLLASTRKMQDSFAWPFLIRDKKTGRSRVDCEVLQGASPIDGQNAEWMQGLLSRFCSEEEEAFEAGRTEDDIENEYEDFSKAQAAAPKDDEEEEEEEEEEEKGSHSKASSDGIPKFSHASLGSGIEIPDDVQTFFSVDWLVSKADKFALTLAYLMGGPDYRLLGEASAKDARNAKDWTAAEILNIFRKESYEERSEELSVWKTLRRAEWFGGPDVDAEDR